MNLSIITLNYNKPQMTLLCIDSIYKNFKKELETGVFEVILVDNGSEKENREKLEKEIGKRNYKNLLLILNNENAGFSTGCNIGAKKAKGDLFLFLNNDIIVEDRGFLEMSLFFEKTSDASVVGADMKNTDGSRQLSYGNFLDPFQLSLFLLGIEKIGFWGLRNPSRVDWVKGSLMMVRRSVFEKLEGFDENIFMYVEDMEFCYRARKNNFFTYFYPSVSATHKDQGSSNRSFAVVNIYKNILYFYKKHKSSFEYNLAKNLLITKAKSLIFLSTITNNSYLKQTYEKALRVI